jgi:hypothetical protein
MRAAHDWVTTLFGHEWHIFDNETRQLAILFCTLQSGSNLTKIIFQGKHFNYFIVMGGLHHVFWSEQHLIFTFQTGSLPMTSTTKWHEI